VAGKHGLTDLSSRPRSVSLPPRQGNYLGIDVAVKEVLPSKDYEVSKYFEREWRIMKSVRPAHCRYPLLDRADLAPSDAIVTLAERSGVILIHSIALDHR
jgi:hypothetical protein